jgi:hypothetical protein
MMLVFISMRPETLSLSLVDLIIINNIMTNNMRA